MGAPLIPSGDAVVRLRAESSARRARARRRRVVGVATLAAAVSMAALAVLAGRRAAERAADAAQDATCAGHHRRFAAIEVENYRRLAAASQEDHATVRAEGDLRLATQVLTAAKDGCEPSGREQSRIDDIRVECHRGVGPLHLYPPPESHPN